MVMLLLYLKSSSVFKHSQQMGTCHMYTKMGIYEYFVSKMKPSKIRAM